MGADYFADVNGEFKLVIRGTELESKQPIYLDIDVISDDLDIYVEKGSER